MRAHFLSAFWLAVFIAAMTGDGITGDKNDCGSNSKKAEVKTEQKTNRQPQTTCPVMGGAVNREIFIDHDGKRIYFCCNPCLEEFEKNPGKYMGKLKEQDIRLEEAPQTPDA